MAVYLKNGFSCKHTEMTICYSILQCCLGILLKAKNENHVPTANFMKKETINLLLNSAAMESYLIEGNVLK